MGRGPKLRELRREPEGVWEALAVAVLEVILVDDIAVCCCAVVR